MPQRSKDGANDEDDQEGDNPAGDAVKAHPGKSGPAQCTVTLSGLLNAIDGVSSQEDCILFATTFVIHLSLIEV